MSTRGRPVILISGLEPSLPNAQRVMRALREFGAPLADVAESDFAQPGATFQIGIAPLRIDILTEISGVRFEEAWADRSTHAFVPFTIPFLGKETLLRNKRSTGQPKDLADIVALESSEPGTGS